MEPSSPLRRLADTLLEEGLTAFVESRRADGMSWRLIARDLREQTDCSVDVTEQTLRTWFAEQTATAS